MAEIGEAVSHCHNLRVLHRDINPWNIFLIKRPNGFAGQPWTARLGDFGLAVQVPRHVHELEGVHGIEGAVALDESALGSLYSAPELGQRYSFPADVFSVGMVLLALWSAPVCTDSDELVSCTEAVKSAAEANKPQELPWWPRCSISKHDAMVLALLLGTLEGNPKDRPSIRAIAEKFAEWSGCQTHTPHTYAAIKDCFQSSLGHSRLVDVEKLRHILDRIGVSERGLATLHRKVGTWDPGKAKAIDYVAFLDWLFEAEPAVVPA